jgi:hypothetical protein
VARLAKQTDRPEPDRPAPGPEALRRRAHTLRARRSAPMSEQRRIVAQLDMLLFGIAALVLSTSCIVVLLLLA